MYSKIVNPKTGRRVSTKGKLGKNILKKYIQALIYMRGGAGGTPSGAPVTNPVSGPPVMPMPPFGGAYFFYPSSPGGVAVVPSSPPSLPPDHSGAETKYALDFVHEDGIYEARRQANHLENSPFSYDPDVLADLKSVAEELER